ncbi:Na+/H+ antiporter NhaA [Streptomyces sp. HNM0645]|uniref:Na+/H+ antiporter NhaA n=1 Tax=Streptomyces sp. HNM0645 TaxID=2782343 RepID=UPI0024B73767|nr:Na+/H+ antiporter NhaA [Streptomyces sp. HNM0645]MDI9887121.1 Na+/H+ antiporter NhaA [Streptomyces sp. HNM0645]
MTRWSRDTRSPLRDFLRTETASAAALVTAALAALVWANLAPAAYEALWRTELSVQLGAYGVGLGLREWVNSGLMALFFFVVGLEARREFDLGELRERRRTALPLVAGLSGMLLPVLVYLAANAGEPSAAGWGVAMSTDTAFALGMLALLGRRMPPGLRVFILSISVVDDFVALTVVAVVYSERLSVPSLLLALAVFAVARLVYAAGVRRGAVFALLAAVLWVALLESGIDPVVTGLAMGLIFAAYPAARGELERASDLFRFFREQPTPELEVTVRRGLASAVSPNERLQRLYHPWAGFVIAPLFALANAGIELGAERLSRAVTSPVTLGVLLAFVIGKPLGILGGSLLTTLISAGRLRPPAGWGAVAVGGTLAGAPFTVSLLIATFAFEGTRLTEAKLGVLTAVLCSFVLGRLLTGVLSLLPPKLRLRALLGRAETIVDLAVPVDPERDHVRGPPTAPVTLVEYGDFECPYCGQAEAVVRGLLRDSGDVRYVWRHLPLDDVHPHARSAAEATEAAAGQDRFWDMHDLLMDHQGALNTPDLVRYAEGLGLDTERFRRDLRKRKGAARVAEDVESADLSGVSGTPSFFVNGRRYHGAYDADGLKAAVEEARARAALTS